MKNKKNNFGFTLIEIVVVTAAVGIIMVAIIGVVISTLKLQNQTKSSSKVVSGGNKILSELKKNVLNSNKGSISCNGTSSITLTNNYDGNLTEINCANNKIASISARETVYLNSGDIVVVDCSQFVSCSTLPSLEMGDVNFKFGIGATVSGVGITQNFEMDVTVRN
ncbi:MAG: type II secretion system protein [Candidatus Shapirobacteria bacterium]|nr:type II secretion system protein [Candidatus Shapirobacteria bacterium]